MRALVTGCAGFIGSHLTESLLSEGIEVVGVDCFNENYARREKLRNLERAQSWDAFDFIPIDLARGDLEELVGAADVVFHLAAEPGVRQSWGGRFESYVRNNVVATQHLLEAATQRPPRCFVYASSSAVYGEAETLPVGEDATPAPVSPYGTTKLAGEHLVRLYNRNFDLPVVALRYFSVYGPRQRPDMAFSRFLRAMVTGSPIEIFGDGAQTRDFTFVDDVVAATRAAGSLSEPCGQIVNVGGGSAVSLGEALAMLAEITGREPNVHRSEHRSGDVQDTAARIDRAEQLLGYAPQIGFREGLARQWEWAETQLEPGPPRL